MRGGHSSINMTGRGFAAGETLYKDDGAMRFGVLQQRGQLFMLSVVASLQSAARVRLLRGMHSIRSVQTLANALTRMRMR